MRNDESAFIAGIMDMYIHRDHKSITIKDLEIDYITRMKSAFSIAD